MIAFLKKYKMKKLFLLLIVIDIIFLISLIISKSEIKLIMASILTMISLFFGYYKYKT